MTLKQTIAFEELRARENLRQVVEYRKVLEWIKYAIEIDGYGQQDIIDEIDKALKLRKK